MKPATVDEYINSCPKEYQGKLSELRKLIRKLVPKAVEKISYAMPFYEYRERLVYFALMKNYIGLYIPPPIIENNKKLLDKYVTTKSSVHLPLSEKLPAVLIRNLVEQRIKWNEKSPK